MVFQIISKIHHVLLTPPCTVAGIKPSERVTMATAIGYLYIYVYVCMCVLTNMHRHTHKHTHTTPDWLRWYSRFSLLPFSKGLATISKRKGWSGSSKFDMMKIFQERSLETYQTLHRVHKHMLTSECFSCDQKETQTSAGTDAVTPSK